MKAIDFLSTRSIVSSMDRLTGILSFCDRGSLRQFLTTWASRIPHPPLSRTLAMLILTLVCGCETNAPVASTGSSKSASAATRKKADPASPPLPRITVQGETVEADEIWLPYMDLLERKVKEIPARELDSYLARQSADLISDKLAEMLLYQRARLRLSVPMEKKIDEYVDAEMRRKVTARYDGIQRRMERELEEQGWSLEGYRENVRRSVVISTYLDEDLKPRVAEPTRAELLEAFQDLSASQATGAKRSMSLIDVRVSEFLPAGDDPSDAKVAEARTLARARITEAQMAIRQGMSFADAARKYSHAVNAPDGGSWGFVNPESVQERFAPALAVLETLKQGEVSDVIETPGSFFLVRCDEVVGGTIPDFQTAQPELREKLFARAYNRRISELVLELRKTAKIEPENLDPFLMAVAADAKTRAAKIRSGP